MNYAYAIERHRKPLLRLVETLFAVIGLTDSGSIARLSKPTYRKLLNLLKPAEAAVRRLIIVMAHGLEGAAPITRAAAKRQHRAGKGKSAKRRKRRRLFRLFDPLLRLDAGLPRRLK